MSAARPDRIEETLAAGDPGPAGLFAIFTRLTFHEALPGTERVTARPWRAILTAVIPVVLITVLTVLTLVLPAPARSLGGPTAAVVGHSHIRAARRTA